MDTLTVYGLGSSVTLELDGSRAPELRAELEKAWNRSLSPLTAGAPENPSTISVSWPPDTTSATDSPQTPTPEALQAQLVDLTQQITRKLIDARMGQLLMLHAGAVANPNNGSAAIFVAPGGTGKTTLTKLMGRDFAYLTDETVGLDPRTGVVLPYPKPLSVRPDDGSGIKSEISPDELGLRPTPTGAVRARYLFVLSRNGVGDAPATFEPLSASDFMLAVAPESSSLSKLPHPLNLLLSLWRSADTVARVTYREGSDVAEVVGRLLNGADPQSVLPPKAAAPQFVDVVGSGDGDE